MKFTELLGRNEIKFGKDNFYCVGVRVKYPEEDTTVTETTHHIHILDRSGSMYSHIDELIENVKKTLTMIDQDDYVTVMWFSGPGEYRTVIKAAKNSPDLIPILDGLKSTIGCTCFSDPIKELKEIIDETRPMCENYNVTLFTDGDPVVPWGVDEEYNRVFTTLKEIIQKSGGFLSFNTIGYGSYYNRDFLRQISESSEYGQMIHSSQIDDYAAIFSNTYQTITNATRKAFSFKVNSKEPYTVVLVMPRSVKAFDLDANDNKEYKVRLPKSGVKLFVYSKDESFSVIINGAEKNSQIDTYNEMYQGLMALAYAKFYNGDRGACINVLNYLGHEELINKVINAYTVTEVGEFTNEFKSLVLSDIDPDVLNKLKDSGECVADTTRECVIDVLKGLIRSGSKIKIPEDYKRIGKKVVDEFNMFTPNDNEYVDSDALVFNKERMNLSIRVKVAGTVKLNPRQAKKVGLSSTYDSYIYRTYTIIKDGALNVNKLDVLTKDGEAKELDLTKYPLVNYKYTDITAEGLIDLYDQITELEVRKKVSEFTDSKNSEGVSVNGTALTEDQVEFLKDYGINEYGCYNAIEPVAQEATDSYVTRQFLLYRKGFSTIPSVNAVDKKLDAGKKLNEAEQYVKGAIEVGDPFDSSSKKLLVELKLVLAGYKMGLILSGKYLPKEFEVDNKDRSTFSYKSENGNEYIAKLSRLEVKI